MKSLVKGLFEDHFANGEGLIVVSNREPYIHKKAGSGIKVERPAGGLTSAMDDVLRATGGTWVAWGSGSGDRDTVDDRSHIQVPPENPTYTLKRVWLRPGEADNYYHGYSNQVLWPLCHITLDRVYYRKKFWEDYKKVNCLFADAVLEEADKNSAVWIHDFHLCLAPRLLRERRPEMTVAHFWHIPWPDWSVFRVCPQSGELLDGLLGNDLIGFQIPLFARNFLTCARESLGAEVDDRNLTVAYKGHTTKLKAFPISIDFDRFNSMASSARTVRMMNNIRDRYRLGQGYIGIGVDRLEYTKALIKRLQAIHLFFDRYEKFRGKFTFIQIAVPTRMKEPYISYKQTVEELIAKINGRYSRQDWRPVVYLDEKVEHEDLVAFYRMADVAVISSVYDGMNLVAKEYAAAQADEKGVLILSELAGAAEELEGALLVNPYDIEGFSDSIYKALTMPQSEKTARMAALRLRIKENDIYRWIYGIIHDIVTVSSVKRNQCCYLFDHVSELRQRSERQKMFLFLDYDGTLAPIAESPDKAQMSEEMRSLLMRVKERMLVAVISGRSLADLKERVGIKDMLYAGNHGMEIWDGETTAANPRLMDNRQSLIELLEKLKSSLSHIKGVFIEDKGITASVHFRTVHARHWGELFDVFKRISTRYEHFFKITPGKKVLEIRPLDAWNKGDAVSWMLEKFGAGTLPVYVGDDITDEDAFRALKSSGISIAVGGSHAADYCLKSQEEVKAFLQLNLN